MSLECLFSPLQMKMPGVSRVQYSSCHAIDQSLQLAADYHRDYLTGSLSEGLF